MSRSIARAAALFACTALVATTVLAQDEPVADFGSYGPGSATQDVSAGGVDTAPPGAGHDVSALAASISAARRGQVAAAQGAMATIGDPSARKLALWALVDFDASALSFSDIDQARRTLADWPRATRRQAAAENALAGSAMGPGQVIAWFAGVEPTTAQGAMALAAAYQQNGRAADAAALIKHWWRDRPFDLATQQAIYTRYGAFLTQDDHIKRADTLLYGAYGTSLEAMLSLLPADQVALAEARLSLQGVASGGSARADALPASVATSPGLAFDRARYLLAHDQGDAALALVGSFAATMPNPDAASKVWAVRRQLINVALRQRDYASAFAAASNTGLTSGTDYTEAEFYAGWLALSKLRHPSVADQHFANIQSASTTPITQARALYWRGRAAEAQNDPISAQTFYAEAGRYVTTFYGQLAAGREGVQQISIGHDPAPTAADRARFAGRDQVKAAHMAIEMGDKQLFRCLVLGLADTLGSAPEYPLLVDLAGSQGDQDLAMRTVRLAAQHDVVLPDRGYPLRAAPVAPEAADAAVVFGITRQESGFDPTVRSPVGARGMMQLMPRTAEIVARKIGVSYSPGRLDEADYNMRLGAAYMGHMINDFSGSYVLATAGYNAGPGRPAQWVGYCGDPRAGGVDPVDFIECIPFSETRNYVMRVMEAAQVYRARLNGGAAPLTLQADLRRGAYVASPSPYQVIAASNTPSPIVVDVTPVSAAR